MEVEGKMYKEVVTVDPSSNSANVLRENTKGDRDDNGMMPLSKKPKLSPAPTNDDDSATVLTKKCDSCQQDCTKLLYTKKQWNKVYGGWICNICLEEERQQDIQKQRLQIKQEKQNCHDQKIADQKAKSSGTFHLQKRCFTCQQTLDRTQYSGKQWKQLYRQCISCICKQQEELRSQPKSKRKIALKKPPFPVTTIEGNLQNQKQLCSSCEENKGRDLFSAKQWKFANDEERMCKDCWSEEELAKEQHRYEEQEEKERRQENATAHQEVRKRCFACHEFKSLKREFSGKQSKKSYGICSTCVTILQEERRNRNSGSGGGAPLGGASDDTIRKVCSNCHLEKSQNEFGRQQWKSKKGVHRKCRTCALAHVKETEEHRQAEKKAREREDEEEENDQILDVGRKKQTSSDINNTYPVKSRRCFGCKQLKSNDNFSLRQVTRTYPICKGCSPSSTSNGGGGSAAATMEREVTNSEKES